jgi:isoquinoline 1-oxidoreductase subunit alpha
MEASQAPTATVGESTAEPDSIEPLVLRINRRPVPFAGRPDEPLLWAIRDHGLTGTKSGCAIGVCGACIVLVDGQPTRSCTMSVGQAADHEITTIEGLASESPGNELHPVQRAFVDAGAPQCGWCMSGQVLTAVALLARSPDPGDAEIERAMSEVLCRCGAYGRIRAAVRAAASEMRPRGSGPRS